MSSTPTTECPRCGAPIPARAAGGLCPACLLSVARQPNGDDVDLADPWPRGGDATSAVAGAAPGGFPRALGGYRLVGVFGRGGMGTVYEAVQLATGRRVALKVLARELDSPEMRQRFLREGRLAAGVTHPNSLYVFGTEEIDGHPAITMEIAGGGTLDDRLRKRGPLPVQEAVDAILGVVSGLEAAYAGGVLHRDVKPSNCFVSPDGSTKIGDFGLSVSMSAKGDSFATGEGVVLGTPAFASPEQLRGAALDARADIYGVGATLFTLLSGAPPVQGRNAVDVVAAALESKPKLVSEMRDEVPRSLARVVARCLAKKPSQRHPDYAALRRALLPFSSARPEPAPIGRRFFAGCIDFAVCAVVPAVMVLSFFGVDVLNDEVFLAERTPVQLMTWAGLVLLGVSYFGFLEGVFGAGVGKGLVGLRVLRPDGQPPGLVLGLARSVIGRSLGEVGRIVVLLAVPIAYVESTSPWILAGASLVVALAFATMRRRNGFATAWDLATGTRVFVKPTGAVRPSVPSDAVAPGPARSVAPSSGSIGPYVVEREIAAGRWIAARDPDLRRPVWLRWSTGELPAARRDLARPGRKRWLQRLATPEGSWNVFEALPGASLTERIRDADGRLRWESARHWLHDLAIEIGAAAKDGTLPTHLGLDHVWITRSGRAILLDEAWPASGRPPAPLFVVDDLDGRQRFLASIASLVEPSAIPLHARPLLDSLAKGRFERLSFLAGSLRSVLAKPAAIDRKSRAASLLAVPLALTVLTTLSLVGYGMSRQPLPPIVDLWEAAESGTAWALRQHAAQGTDLNERGRREGSTPLIVAASLGHFDAAEVLLDHGADVGARRDDGATALHLAARSGHAETARLLLRRGADPKARDAEGETPLDWVERRIARPSGALEGDTHPTSRHETRDGRLDRSFREILLLLREPPRPETRVGDDSRLGDAADPYAGSALHGLLLLSGLAVLQAIVQLVGICCFRSTPGQMVFGFAVVDRTGSRASRLRLLGRWAITWAIPVAVLIRYSPVTYDGSLRVPLALLSPWLLGVAAAVRWPSCGPLDRLSGCRLVPR